MDWGIIGLIDVIIILFTLITAIVGYKTGFLKKAIGLVSFFVALIVSLVFCKPFAGFLTEHDIIYGGLYNKIEYKVSTIENIEYLDYAPDMSEAIQETTDLPKFIADFLATKITENTSSVEVIGKVSTAIADVLMVIISVLIIVIGVNVLDDIEGTDATIFGFACIVFGIFLGIISLMCLPPL